MRLDLDTGEPCMYSGDWTPGAQQMETHGQSLDDATIAVAPCDGCRNFNMKLVIAHIIVVELYCFPAPYVMIFVLYIYVH